MLLVTMQFRQMRRSSIVGMSGFDCISDSFTIYKADNKSLPLISCVCLYYYSTCATNKKEIPYHFICKQRKLAM